MTETVQRITFTECGRSQYADHEITLCCGESLHRPAGSVAGDSWFCKGCGEVHPDNALWTANRNA